MPQVGAPPRDPEETLEIPRLGERASRALTRNSGGPPATRMSEYEIMRSALGAGYSHSCRSGGSDWWGGRRTGRVCERGDLVRREERNVLRWRKLIGQRGCSRSAYQSPSSLRKRSPKAPSPQRLSGNSDGDPAVVKFHEQEVLITCRSPRRALRGGISKVNF